MNTLDFDDDKQLEGAFAEAVKVVAPPAGLKAVFRQRLFGPAACASLSPRPKTGRVTFRKVLVVGIPASVLAALVIWLCRPETQLVSVAYAEFQAVLKKSDPADWVHFFEADGREIWQSFHPYPRIYSNSAGRVYATDRRTNRHYDYDAAKNTLTVSFPRLPGDSERFNSFAEFILDQIERWARIPTIQVGKGTATFNGKAVTVYLLTGTDDRGVKGTAKYYFDPQTNRVVGAEKSTLGGWLKQRLTVDYPARGPADVYEVGVPRHAKIIDNTPSPAVLDLVEKVEAAGAAMHSFYRVSVQIQQSFSEETPPKFGGAVEITYYKDADFRRDEYYMAPCPSPISREQAVRYLDRLRTEIPVDRLEDVESWLSKRKPTNIFICNSRQHQGIHYSLNDQGKLTATPVTGRSVIESLQQRARQTVVELDGAPTLVEQRGPWGKLVGIENHPSNLKTERWYFNPERQYCCEKSERQIVAHDSNPARTDSKEVLEYARTPAGRWFAKRIRKVDYGGRETMLIVNFEDDSRRMAPKVFDGSRISAQDLVPYHHD